GTSIARSQIAEDPLGFGGVQPAANDRSAISSWWVAFGWSRARRDPAEESGDIWPRQLEIRPMDSSGWKLVLVPGVRMTASDAAEDLQLVIGLQCPGSQ